MKKLVRVKALIEKIAKQTGLEGKIIELKILQNWQGEVGTEISNHTTPIKLFKGKLFVKVDSPIWMNQLTFIKKDIINKLNSSIKANIVKDIFFTLK